MKTLAIRLEDDEHARLTILSRLAGETVTDTIRAAIAQHLATMAANPELSAKAASLTEAIDREAAEQRSAIAALFGTTDHSESKPARTQRGKS